MIDRMSEVKKCGNCKHFGSYSIKNLSGTCSQCGMVTYYETIAEKCNSFERKEFMVQSNVEQHREICEYLNKLYEKKNADYGDSFHETYLQEGMAMARIRVGDKYRRFCTLSKNSDNQQVKEETIRDTLLDLANYAIMTVMEIDNEKGGK